MRSKMNLAAFASGISISASTAIAQQVPEQRLPVEKFNWPQSQANQAGSAMRPGLQTIFVLGDGTSKGLFSVVFRVPANTKIPPHSHLDERSCFVLSGMWYFGYGTVRDEDQLQALPAGSSYTEPAGRMHFAGTKDVEAIAECTAIGRPARRFSIQQKIRATPANRRAAPWFRLMSPWCPELAQDHRRGRTRGSPLSLMVACETAGRQISAHGPWRPVLKVVLPRRLLAGMTHFDPIRSRGEEIRCRAARRAERYLWNVGSRSLRIGFMSRREGRATSCVEPRPVGFCRTLMHGIGPFLFR